MLTSSISEKRFIMDALEPGDDQCLTEKLVYKVLAWLRWLNTVLRAVSGNLRDGACFQLDKQTWRRKCNGTEKTIFQNLLVKIL